MIHPIPPIHPRVDPDTTAFHRAAWIMLVFTVFAFALRVAVTPARLDRYEPMVVAHAVAMLGWLALFTLQTGLAQRGRVVAHKTLGALSILPVGAAVWTGLVVSRRFGAIHILLGNLVQLGSLAVLWGAGALCAVTHRIAAHRRLMFLATLATMTPPISRLTQSLGLPNATAAIIHMGLILTLLPGWDLALRPRLHPATMGGIGFILAALASAIFAGLFPPWAAAVTTFVQGASTQ